MEIQEGHAVLAFDYNVRRSNTDCLFNLKETAEEHKERLM